MPTRCIKHLCTRRQIKESQDQLNLSIAPRLEHRIHEPEVVLVEDLRPDELPGQCYR
jgi:hypothetical protein